MPKARGELRLSIKHNAKFFITQPVAFQECVSVDRVSEFRAEKNSEKIFLMIIQNKMFKTLEQPQNYFVLPEVNFNDSPIIISSGASFEEILRKSSNLSGSTSKIKIDTSVDSYYSLTYLPFFMKCGNLGRSFVYVYLLVL
jgi:hypothetical protein